MGSEVAKRMSIFKRIKYNSPVIITYALVSFLALLIQHFTNGLATFYIFSVYRSSFSDPLAYFRIFTHVLGHINFTHYLNNFLIIFLIGPMLEEKYGSKRLIVMVILTAFVTGLLNIVFFETILLGASGVAFMLILLSSFANIKKGQIPLTLLLVALAYIGKEVYDGMFAVDNISHVTHIVGGLCGAVIGFFANNKE